MPVIGLVIGGAFFATRSIVGGNTINIPEFDHHFMGSNEHTKQIKWSEDLDEQAGRETAKTMFDVEICFVKTVVINKQEFNDLGVQNHRARLDASLDEIFPPDDRPRGTDDETVRYFMETDKELPPIMILNIDNKLYMLDGVHRLVAAYLTNSPIKYCEYEVCNVIGGKYSSIMNKEEAVKLDYPYRKYFMTEEDLAAAFEHVKNTELKLVQTDYKIISIPDADVRWLDGPPAIIECDPKDYHTINWMSDWFNEQCRLACRRYDESVSPIEYWNQNKESIVEKVSQPTHEKLSDEVYKNVAGCNNFRPGLLTGMIKLLGKDTPINSVLDFSSGWGDRLIGAIAAGVSYVGVDPNSCVHVGYKQIIDKFAEDSSKYIMIEAPFQTAELPVETHYDLVFTSPPYFNLEIYSDDASQSVSEFTQPDDWFNGFLITSLRKAWNVLNSNGFMVIIINNIRNKADYVLRMCKEINKFAGAKYQGILSYAEKKFDKRTNKSYYKSPQPMWIWQKEGIKVSEVSGSEDMTNITEPISITDLNPKLVTSEIINDHRVFTVIRDDLLHAGTKQRAMGIIKNIPNDEVVYSGPFSGYAQLAIAIGCKVFGKKATVFTTRDDYITNLRAKKYGANIIAKPGKSLKELQTIGAEYAKKHNAYLLPFGFDSDEFREELCNKLIEALGDINRDFNKTIWVIAGSSTLLNVLYKVFPNAKFAAVQVGKTIWPDQINDRTKLFVAPEKFYDDAINPPPYPSVIKYDAKVWQFVSRFGESGDMIWNVGGD